MQVGYCILHNGRMCVALEGRYLNIRTRCLRAADALGALSYEAQAPLKMRPTSLGRERACESVNAYLQARPTALSQHIWLYHIHTLLRQYVGKVVSLKHCSPYWPEQHHVILA